VRHGQYSLAVDRSTRGTSSRDRLCGPRPPTRSSRTSPDISSESLTQDTSRSVRFSSPARRHPGIHDSRLRDYASITFLSNSFRWAKGTRTSDHRRQITLLSGCRTWQPPSWPPTGPQRTSAPARQARQYAFLTRVSSSLATHLPDTLQRGTRAIGGPWRAAPGCCLLAVYRPQSCDTDHRRKGSEEGSGRWWRSPGWPRRGSGASITATTCASDLTP